ncbi:hypothetical protein V1283_006596 [Bradyrhizobium sp. AZCC 2262]|uniref:hypothetical protein n=1 Tax=Bradyrhizobium sp. AZCC 2262 TaxID=3117022 RepID=UPI002FEF8BC6
MVVVVVEGATLVTFVAGTTTMLIIGVLLNIVGLGIFCWALFALATHALSFFVGVAVGTYSFHAGTGPFGAIVVGFVAAGFTFEVGRFAFSIARSRVVRLVIGLLFAVPAARAGYGVTLAFAHLGVPSESLRESFAILGAIAVGGAAWASVSMRNDPWPGTALSPIQPPNELTTTTGM